MLAHAPQVVPPSVGPQNTFRLVADVPMETRFPLSVADVSVTAVAPLVAFEITGSPATVVKDCAGLAQVSPRLLVA